MDNIFEETQNTRDIEIAEYTGIDLKEILTYQIASKKSILLNVDGDIDKDDYTYIYKDFKHLNLAEYLKTLSSLTVSRRCQYIMNAIKILNGLPGKKVLDFGSGTGSHGIACSQFGADEVHFLDVDGPLLKFASWRAEKRNLGNTKFITCDTKLPESYFDMIICLDVLEHVADPIKEIKRITKSLKSKGILILEVSKMKKFTSGHFSKAIDAWKANGPTFMKSNYTIIQKNIWRKENEQI